MPNADAVDMRDRGLAPACAYGIPDVGSAGLKSSSSSVKVLCCILQWLRHLPRGPLPIEYLFLGTAGPNHWFLAPVGATSSMPWAQAHGPQAADAPAASSWLTKEENSYRAATGGSSMAWIQRRLDGTSCVGELCARRPARKLVRDRGLAPTAFKMSPLSGLNSHSS